MSAQIPDLRLDAPAFHRNKDAIADVIARQLPRPDADVLEIASGTGQHAVHMAALMPEVTWWPSDIDDQSLASIEAWRRHAGCRNVRSARRMDVTSESWLGEDMPTRFDLIFCANMIHIAPWRIAEGLIAGAARYLASPGRLLIYGPFKRDGRHTAPSNAAFDDSLRRQNPSWGVRDIAEVTALAEANGLTLIAEEPMPANNLTLVFGK